jgi:hypothetical protein
MYESYIFTIIYQEIFIQKANFGNAPLYFGLSTIYKGKSKEKFA